MDREMIVWLARVVAAGVAVAWGSLTPLVQLLIALMVLDILSGLLAAYGAQALSSSVSFRGMARKGLALVLVGAAAVLQQHLQLPLADAVAGFYAASELISITENAARAGLPIPAALQAALAKLSPEAPEREERR